MFVNGRGEPRGHGMNRQFMSNAGDRVNLQRYCSTLSPLDETPRPEYETSLNAALHCINSYAAGDISNTSGGSSRVSKRSFACRLRAVETIRARHCSQLSFRRAFLQQRRERSRATKVRQLPRLLVEYLLLSPPSLPVLHISFVPNLQPQHCPYSRPTGYLRVVLFWTSVLIITLYFISAPKPNHVAATSHQPPEPRCEPPERLPEDTPGDPHPHLRNRPTLYVHDPAPSLSTSPWS